MKINSFSFLDLEYYLLRSPFMPTAYMYVIFAISLWVLVHLNYRDIKQLSQKGGEGGGGGGSQAPQDHPVATPQMRKKKFRHRLFTSSIKREIWHFLALVVQ